MVKTVHVVYKTHLDIGFTDLADNVVKQYKEQYIPKAVELAEKLDKEGEKQFIWTTGSWLIHHYLKHASAAETDKMEQAVKNGYITWHALPFTTHTELLSQDLLQYGLSLSNKLDKRFGRETTAAKMTDVPGHTIAMVPDLAAHGIKYLHLGVNPASKIPAVPKLFRWKAPCGAEVIVNYSASYGELLEVDGLDDVLVFAHTGDNCGPPEPDAIKAQYDELAGRFPGAHIKASTLDAFAEKVMEVKDHLPVITEEIGDTWIHGAGTDPYKVSAYRELNRLRSKWIDEGSLVSGSSEYENFSENLLLIAEHTWGMDLKKFLPDFNHYSKAAFERARRKDIFGPADIPDKYKYIGAFALGEIDDSSKELFESRDKTFSYSLFESSWKEQREYLLKAVESLRGQRKSDAEHVLKKLTSSLEDPDNGTHMMIDKKYKLGEFEVSFGKHGEINYLKDSKNHVWADESHTLANYSYQTYGPENYNHWFENYMCNLPQTHPWADSDFGKPGLEYADPAPEFKSFSPSVLSIKSDTVKKGDRVIVDLRMPETASSVSGSPRRVVLEYLFRKGHNSIDLVLYWREKDPYRLPEANWLSLNPIVHNPNLWTFNKLGRNISPLNVVKDGNRNLHAVDEGFQYGGSDGAVKVETLDAVLISPGNKNILNFNSRFGSMENGLHVNLQNNIWGTNFPMWYGDDAKFRFRLSLDSY